MTKRTRRRINAGSKAKIALEALRERATLAELAHQVDPNQVYAWQKQLRNPAEWAFESGSGSHRAERPPNRRTLVDRQHDLRRVIRSGVCRPQAAANDNDFTVMEWLDELFTAWSFADLRRMTKMLRQDGRVVNGMLRLVHQIGIATLGPNPCTNKPAPRQRTVPYLPRAMTIDQPNQLWCADITSPPVGRDFLDLVAIKDRASRAVPSWRLSGTTGSSLYVAAREEALARSEQPEIFNTDQGRQVTSATFTDILKAARGHITMGGPWPVDGHRLNRMPVGRSHNHSNAYLDGYANSEVPRAEISWRMRLYNHPRPHPALGNRTAMAVCRESLIQHPGKRLVAMMLRFGNTSPLPTHPQPHQQQELAL